MSLSRNLSRRWLAPVLALGAASALAGAAHAQAAHGALTMSEHSSSALDYAISLPTETPYADSGTLVGGGNDFWDIGQTFGGIPLFYTRPLDDSVEIYAVSWLEPGSSFTDLAHAEFNVMQISPSGNRGNTNFLITSDATYAQMRDLTFHGCNTPGVYFDCPILADGASYTMTAMYTRTNAPNVEGDFTVTFHDRGDVLRSGAPEPVAWALMLAGFGLAGAALRRRSAVRA